EPTTPIRSVATCQPHLSSSGPIWSSPITRKNRREITQKKGSKKRIQTLQKRREERNRREPSPTARAREDILDEALAMLKRHDLTWGDLVLYVSDPASRKGAERYSGMFEIPDRVKQVLTYWVSSFNSPTGRDTVRLWIMEYVKRLIGLEGSRATEDGVLQSRKLIVNESFVANFDLKQICAHLRKLCPTMTELLQEFTLTRRQKKAPTKVSMERNDLVRPLSIRLLGERSQRNSYGRHVLGLYLYATGAQRQTISVLSRMGVCSSYTTIAGRSGWKGSRRLAQSTEPRVNNQSDSEPSDRSNSDKGAGLLRRLSESCRHSARILARTHELGHVYDNINWILHAAEQIMGRKDSIENGTCATVFPLFSAPRSDMYTSDFLESFDIAPPLTQHDIILDSSENNLLTTLLEHNVLRIITSHGGSTFARFAPDVLCTMPRTSECIALHKTDVYPLRAMNIEEMSVKGNAEVLETVFGELGHDLACSAFTETVKIVFGDQLSVARLRAVINNRAGHDSFSKSLLYTAFAPGLFHYQMAATYAVLETHWGNPSLGPHDPACLSWHNTILDRKPFVLSNRPSYRTACDLIFHSLYGRVIHCLGLVTGRTSLEEYAENLTFSELQQHAREIVSRFIKPGTAGVSKLRNARARELLEQDMDSENTVPLTQGDMVFENACLFLRDALLLREFTDAIKSGDSGRIIIILKVFALSFRGSGHTKYAQEALFVIHNLEYIWPKPFRTIMTNNWLVNTTGQPNHWYPVDLLQEHNIFWTKTIYSAQGSGASWDWLEMISPCINVLRTVVTSINEALGSKQGTKHATPDLTRDLEELQRTLAATDVYRIHPGRVIDGEKAVVPNVVSVGLSQLSGPLCEYNRMMSVLKRRRR
ncbi:hypothetical protein DAEQUDRAFT_646439, partial [Daedalea quercina L-15889]